MEKIDLKAEKRGVSGRKVKNLRKDGLLPGVVYGRGFEPQSIQLKYGEFEKAFRLAGESTLVNLIIGEKIHPVIIHEAATDPVSDKFIHADFYKVRMDEKISADVKLFFTGESLAVKDLGGILVKSLDEVEVEALPGDLPHEIEVDISALKNFESDIKVKDLKVSDKVEILSNPEETVATVQEPRSEKELEEATTAPVEAGVEQVEVGIKKPEAEEELPAEETPKPEEK